MPETAKWTNRPTDSLLSEVQNVSFGDAARDALAFHLHKFLPTKDKGHLNFCLRKCEFLSSPSMNAVQSTT